MGLNPFLLIINLSDFMRLFGKNKGTTNTKCYLTLGEFPIPSSIPLEVEIEKQKAELGGKNSPFDAYRKAYEKFGLNAEEICYNVGDGNLSIQVNCYSKEDASKYLEDKKKRECLEKAFNIHIDKSNE
jgi:hypothetical protein